MTKSSPECGRCHHSIYQHDSHCMVNGCSCFCLVAPSGPAPIETDAALIARARNAADRGVQSPDGYDYIVPAKDLAEISALLRELAQRLEEQPMSTEMQIKASNVVMAANQVRMAWVNPGKRRDVHMKAVWKVRERFPFLANKLDELHNEMTP